MLVFHFIYLDDKTKLDAENHYKGGKFQAAVTAYTVATRYSIGRAPWEPGATTREEIAVSLSNRSAAMVGLGSYIDAVVDAVVVIGLKRPWSKGHLRKGKALLAMGRPEDAKEVVDLGLSFEPENKVSYTGVACWSRFANNVAAFRNYLR